MVLASHSDWTIRSMCNKAIMMEAGRIVASGPVDEICDRYYQSVHAAARAAKSAKAPRAGLLTETGEILVREANLPDRLKRTSGTVRFTSVAARDSSGLARWEYEHEETVKFRFEYEVFEKVPHLAFFFRLYLADGKTSSIQYVTDILETISLAPVDVGQCGAIELAFPNLKLMPNAFRLYVCFTSPGNVGAYDVIDDNVELPALVVKPNSANDRRLGTVSLSYELRSSGIDVPAASECGVPNLGW